jgi:hypothetical protein
MSNALQRLFLKQPVGLLRGGHVLLVRHLRERSLISGSGRTVHLVDPGGLRSLAGV